MVCLDLILEMDGEVIERADPHIGLLHREQKNLAESKPLIKALVTWIDSITFP